MRIAVMGTGPVGQALAGKLAELGHELTVGTRDPAETLSRTPRSRRPLLGPRDGDVRRLLASSLGALGTGHFNIAVAHAPASQSS